MAVIFLYLYFSKASLRMGACTQKLIFYDDEIKITAFNISPESEEAKATETLYKRVK